MKHVVVCASGGLDSTVRLHQILTGTSHKVTALYIPEGAYYGGPSTDYWKRERTAFDAVTAWLKKNVRTFDSVVGEVKLTGADGRRFDPEARVPIRPGFRENWRTYWGECRLSSIGFNVREIGSADETHTGITAWNRRVADYYTDHYKTIYREWTDTPMVEAWVAKDPATGIWSGRSRLRNYKEIPAALDSLIVECAASLPGAVDCGCRNCITRRFWKTVVKSNWHLIDAIEDRVAQQGCIGRYYYDADPLVYEVGDFYRGLDDIAAWKTWLKEEHGVNA